MMDILLAEEKERVRKLGKEIGYGNIMHLASDCWKEMLIEHYGSSVGAFEVCHCITAQPESDKEE